MSNLFIRRLINRHPATRDADANQETVAFAAAAAAFEILLRASRAHQVPPPAPSAKPTREQILALAFGSMCSIGLIAEVAHEGVVVSADVVGKACAITFLPGHAKAERIEIGGQASKLAFELAKTSPAYLTAVGRLAVVIVRETPAKLPNEPLNFTDGKPVDELLAPLMGRLLTSEYQLPAG